MAGAIFGGNINSVCTALMMVAMLVFAVAWEAFTGHLDKKFEDNIAHKEMLTKVYKELMILGFIAFAVILCKELKIITWNHATLSCFEFCDLLVSICVLIYVGNTAMSSFTMHITQREWDRSSMKPTVQVVDDVEYYLQKVQESGCKRIMHILPFFARNWREESEFKILQLLFKLKFNLPGQFDYVMYIKAILERHVVSMANISTYHWVLLMLLNGLWYVVMVYVMPTLGVSMELEPAEDPQICILACDNAEVDGHRRRLGSAVPAPCAAHLPRDVCKYNQTSLARALDELRNISGGGQADVYWNQCQECKALALKDQDNDIAPSATMVYLAVFALCGWLVVLLQSCVNFSLSRRIIHILQMHDAVDDSRVPPLLTHLQEKVRNKMNRRLTMPVDEDDDEGAETLIIETTVGKLHHRRCIPMAGEADEPETDHVMVFKHSNKNSNDILSIRSSERLMFAAQFFQLVIDFHFGFYVVHMQQRVPYAFDVKRVDTSHSLSRFVVHSMMVLPFFIMMYLLMMMTRKISLLVAVLHLNDEAVSDVLEHMEMVKTVRRRIRDTLRKSKIVRSKADPGKAEAILERAKKGELAVLSDLSKREDLRTGRITRKEMNEILFSGEVAGNVTVTSVDLADFLDRKAYAAFMLESKADQATAQTAKTLTIGVVEDEQQDSIRLAEFSSFLVRFIAELIYNAREYSPKKSIVKNFKKMVTSLDSVDEDALENAYNLALCKHVFRVTDSDNSGAVSPGELRSALRRYKISITKSEFKHIFRVIDPDQSKSMAMDEWIDFMMASDSDLELQTTEATYKEQKSNAEKGGSLEVLVSEGAGVFLGERAGHLLGGVVGAATDVVGGTIGIVGKGLDTIGLQDVREAVIGEDESDRGRRSPGATSPTSPNSRDTVNPVFGGEEQTPVPEELRTPAAARAELSDDEAAGSAFT